MNEFRSRNKNMPVIVFSPVRMYDCKLRVGSLQEVVGKA